MFCFVLIFYFLAVGKLRPFTFLKCSIFFSKISVPCKCLKEVHFLHLFNSEWLGRVTVGINVTYVVSFSVQKCRLEEDTVT